VGQEHLTRAHEFTTKILIIPGQVGYLKSLSMSSRVSREIYPVEEPERGADSCKNIPSRGPAGQRFQKIYRAGRAGNKSVARENAERCDDAARARDKLSGCFSRLFLVKL